MRLFVARSGHVNYHSGLAASVLTRPVKYRHASFSALRLPSTCSSSAVRQCPHQGPGRPGRRLKGQVHAGKSQRLLHDRALSRCFVTPRDVLVVLLLVSNFALLNFQVSHDPCFGPRLPSFSHLLLIPPSPVVVSDRAADR